MPKSDVRLGDYFAGIGGFSIAGHWVGWSTEFFCEWEDYPAEVLRKNFPGVTVDGDITKRNGKYHEADIITGGVPCQPYSTAGKGLGEDDPRYLFPSFIREVRAIKPAIAVIENVRGLLSNRNGVVFEKVCSSLEGEGYAVQTFLLPACAFGAPHRRDRVWIVAYSTRQDDWRHIRESYVGQAQQSGVGTQQGTSTYTNGTQAWPSGEGQLNDSRFGGGTLGAGEEALLTKDGESDTNDHPGHVVNATDNDQEGLSLGGDRPRQGEQGPSTPSRGDNSNGEGSGSRHASDTNGSQRGEVGSSLRDEEPNGGLSRGEEGSGGFKSSDKDASYTPGKRLEEIHDGIQEPEPERGIAGGSVPGDTSILGRGEGRSSGEQKPSAQPRTGPPPRSGGGAWQTPWPQVATELCRVDAGLPSILDSSERTQIHKAVAAFGREEVERILGIDLREVEDRVHRTSRLKALGNTIVPHVAYCVLDSIDRHIEHSIESGVWPPQIDMENFPPFPGQ